MNQDERSEIGQLWLSVASMYGKEIGRDALRLMLNAVSDLGAAEVKTVLEDWVKGGKHRMHPLPGDIRDILCPPTDPLAYGREVAGRCVRAIGLYGWPQPAKARAFIGEEGWAVIEEKGGWTHFCQGHGVDIDPGQFAAQARDRVADQVAKKGIQPRVVELVAPERQQLAEPEPKQVDLVKSNASEVMKGLFAEKLKRAEEESHSPGPA